MDELFANFEVNKAPRWKRLSRLAGLSFVLHVLFFVAILYVPILREMFHVAGRFKDAQYVDEDYEKTQIRDAVMISADQRFTYPPGYFSTPAAPAPTVVEQFKPVPAPKPRPTPKPTPEPKPSPTPSPSPSPEQERAADADAREEPKTKEDAEKALDQMAAKNGVTRPMEDKINKKPLKDWLASSNELYKSGKLDLSNTIEVVIVAQRDEKGKLHDAQVVRKTGDPVLAGVATDLVGAINDSNILYFLEGAGQLRFTIKLDSVKVTAMVESEVDSEARAEKLSVTYGSMLLLGKIAKNDKDEGIIYQNTRISARGKQVVVNFSLPRQAATEMVKKQLPTAPG